LRRKNEDGKNSQAPPHQTGGFTLIELLVVVAVIGILTALLLAALSKAKSRAQTLTCLNNLKQLELCCHLYSADFDDYLVPNQAAGFVPEPMSTMPAARLRFGERASRWKIIIANGL
jgi:prepilin-type N-terminal cleavage/methylation domain-containing protein